MNVMPRELPESVDWSQPVNRSHRLNRGLLVRLLAIPGRHVFGSTTWQDLCRNSNGTLTNMNPAGTWGGPAGRPGGWGALRFNESGTDDYVAATVSGVVGASQHTYAAWFRVMASTGDIQCIIRLGDMGTAGPGADRSRRIDLHTNGSLSSNYLYDGTATSATGLWSIGPWYRVVATQTASTQSLYLNGRLVASASRTPPALDSGLCSIGRRATDIFQYPCNAMLDDIVIADRGWSAAEVAEDFGIGQRYLAGVLNRWELAAHLPFTASNRGAALLMQMIGA